MFDGYRDGYVLVDECAARMGLTVDQVRDLVRRRVLRSTADGMWVQPAIVTGAVE